MKEKLKNIFTHVSIWVIEHDNLITLILFGLICFVLMLLVMDIHLDSLSK